jgi:hypothetical protein
LKTADTLLRPLAALRRFLRETGISDAVFSRLTRSHPFVDRSMRQALRALYLRRWFREGPVRRGTASGKSFVILNHSYDLDIAAYCAADTPHTLWVIDPFAIFTDVFHFFPPEHRDLECVYGEGAMADSIARYKAAFITGFAQRLKDATRLDALITPSDTFFYLRPLIEALRKLGVPTIVQDKEGTIAPGAIMDDHARILTERYPPIADQFYFWSESHMDFWRRVGIDLDRASILGQPRSDFFFHPARWPSKASFGLAEDKKLIVVFTYDADSYARSSEPNKDRPWYSLRADTHEAAIAIAREREDVEVVIKAHPQQAELDEVRAEIAEIAHPRVRLITGATSGSHLMVRADVIVGFQSTAMIEAMMTNKPVIYAGWGAQHDKLSDALVPIHRSGGCVIATDREMLVESLRSAVDGSLSPTSDMTAARKRFTDRYFFEADGRCAERVLNACAAFVVEHQRVVGDPAARAQ